jgi:hypothetical protein
MYGIPIKATVSNWKQFCEPGESALRNEAMTLFASCGVFLAGSVVQQPKQTPPTVSGATTPALSDSQSMSGGGGQASTADHVLEDGTPVKLRLTTQLSSGNAKPGQTIDFEVVDDLALDGITILHRKTQVMGVVVESEKKKRLGRPGILNFTIASLKLADGENIPLRSFNNTTGDSHVTGVTALALNTPLAAAPFFLLMHGENSTFPKGTEITVFTSGNTHLDLDRFRPRTPDSASQM